MHEGQYRVNAVYDEDAEQWTAKSPQVPGFSCEAETLEELLDALRKEMPPAAEAAHGPPIGDFDREVRITTAFPACGC
ncbi:MAG: DUF1902 domain-containing protein [Alphaproteobacteria bacterium]|jgi:hypothetical protein|nr:DUF1902 domain-containing protein [Alphaproteobacteria bacterium]